VLGRVTQAAAAQVSGELRCAFLSDTSDLLLVGAGDVDKASRATAVVMRGATPVLLTARAPGGFDAMAQGSSFADTDLTASDMRGRAIPQRCRSRRPAPRRWRSTAYGNAAPDRSRLA
jgi:hypothetical protein